MASNYDELYHHGILGMHWGIRRYQPYPDGHTGGREIGQAAKAKKKKYVYPAADIKTMSDDQLRRKVNRMNLEKRYADMSTQKYVRENKARRKVSEVGQKAGNLGADKIYKAGSSVNKVLDKTKITDKRIDLDSLPKNKGDKGTKTGKEFGNSVRAVGKGVKGVNDLVKSAQRINRVDYRNEKMYEATKMSYKELQTKVNRMDMERQYKELEKSAYTTKGKQALEELWPILAAAGAIGAGAKATTTGVAAAKKLLV